MSFLFNRLPKLDTSTSLSRGKNNTLSPLQQRKMQEMATTPISTGCRTPAEAGMLLFFCYLTDSLLCAALRCSLFKPPSPSCAPPSAPPNNIQPRLLITDVCLLVSLLLLCLLLWLAMGETETSHWPVLRIPGFISDTKIRDANALLSPQSRGSHIRPVM